MNKLKLNEILNVTVSKIVSEGKSIATFNNHTIFVNQGLPEDVVDVKLVSKKKGHFFANIISFQKKSPLRKTSTCSHFPVCGGCQYMDVDYSDQLILKKNMLLDSIHRFYPELSQILSPIIPSISNTYYRNKMEFSFSSSDSKLVCGLKKRHSYDHVISVDQCLLQDSQTPALVSAIVEFMTSHDIGSLTCNTTLNCLSHVMIRHSKYTNQFMINLFITSQTDHFFEDFVSFLNQRFNNMSSIFLTHHNQTLGSPTTQTILRSYGDTHLQESIDWLKCFISPLSFFQTNSLQAVELYKTIQLLADLKATDTLLDLYCGTGTIGLFLSKQVKHVIGIEENPHAIEDAKTNSIKNNISNIEFRCGRVKNILKFESFDVDCVVVDPPRSGMTPKALRRLCDLKCKKIIYVSCHPITLLRDLAEFKEQGYRVTSFIPVDMFPNTYHIESVVKLELN